MRKKAFFKKVVEKLKFFKDRYIAQSTSSAHQKKIEDRTCRNYVTYIRKSLIHTQWN